MRILLDTHLVLDLLQGKPIRAGNLADLDRAHFFVSVASLWEIAIKTRLGKLDASIALADIARFLEIVGVTLVPIEARHVVVVVEPQPETRDPFDRLLLAVCQADGYHLATVDKALQRHRLTYRDN